MNWGAFLAGAGAFFSLGGFGALVYETFALLTGKMPPITYFVRNYEQKGGMHPVLVLCCIVAMLIGHFLHF